MKCKDCYHFDVCNNYLNDFREIGFLLGHNLNAIGCRFFKDKSKIIELPCKAGDTVYSIHTNHNGEQKIYSIRIQKIELSTYGIEFKSIAMIGQIHESDFGKTVFLTREEAEQALKECENK